MISQFISFIDSLFQGLITQKFPIVGCINFITNFKCKLEICSLNGQWKLFFWNFDHIKCYWCKSFLYKVWNKIFFILSDCLFDQLFSFLPIFLKNCSFKLYFETRWKINFKNFILIIEREEFVAFNFFQKMEWLLKGFE